MRILHRRGRDVDGAFIAGKLFHERAPLRLAREYVERGEGRRAPEQRRTEYHRRAK
jgi:hypothetical protein